MRICLEKVFESFRKDVLSQEMKMKEDDFDEEDENIQ
jgi:hypothetical protein